MTFLEMFFPLTEAKGKPEKIIDKALVAYIGSLSEADSVEFQYIFAEFVEAASEDTQADSVDDVYSDELPILLEPNRKYTVNSKALEKAKSELALSVEVLSDASHGRMPSIKIVNQDILSIMDGDVLPAEQDHEEYPDAVTAYGDDDEMLNAFNALIESDGFEGSKSIVSDQREEDSPAIESEIEAIEPDQHSNDTETAEEVLAGNIEVEPTESAVLRQIAISPPAANGEKFKVIINEDDEDDDDGSLVSSFIIEKKKAVSDDARE